MVCVVSLSFSRLSSPCDVARFGIKFTTTVTDLWKNVLNIVSFFNEAADTISKSNVQKPDFSFQFFEWVSIKSRSTYVYNIYINIETGCIGNMSNRICIKSRWQFWMQLYSNCNLITRDPSLPQTSFTLSGDRILSRLLLLQQWNRQLLRIFENDVITRFIDNFSFEQCSYLPRVNIHIRSEWAQIDLLSHVGNNKSRPFLLNRNGQFEYVTIGI